MRRIPAYNHVRAEDLPPYQLFKRWQKATNTDSWERFGRIGGEEMLSDIKKYKPRLLEPIRNLA